MSLAHLWAVLLFLLDDNLVGVNSPKHSLSLNATKQSLCSLVVYTLIAYFIKIKITDRISQNDKAELLKASDVYLCTTTWNVNSYRLLINNKRLTDAIKLEMKPPSFHIYSLSYSIFTDAAFLRRLQREWTKCQQTKTSHAHNPIQ